MLSWLLAFSPILLLVWLAVTGRFSSESEFPTRPDPPGFGERLKYYVPLVRAVRQLPESYSADSLSDFEAALDLAADPFPPIYPTKLEDNFQDDLVRPIVESQKKLMRWMRDRLQTLWQHQQYDHALVLLAKGLRVAQIMNNCDSGAHSRSCALAIGIYEQIEELLPKTSPKARNFAATELLKQETKQVNLSSSFKNDVELLSFAAQTHKNGITTDEVHWAKEALEAILQGQPIDVLMQRLRRWGQTATASRMWQLVSCWNLMIKYETNLRSRKASIIKMLGANPDSMVSQNLFAGKPLFTSGK